MNRTQSSVCRALREAQRSETCANDWPVESRTLARLDPAATTHCPCRTVSASGGSADTRVRFRRDSVRGHRVSVTADSRSALRRTLTVDASRNDPLTSCSRDAHAIRDNLKGRALMLTLATSRDRSRDSAHSPTYCDASDDWPEFNELTGMLPFRNIGETAD